MIQSILKIVKFFNLNVCIQRKMNNKKNKKKDTDNKEQGNKDNEEIIDRNYSNGIQTFKKGLIIDVYI